MIKGLRLNIRKEHMTEKELSRYYWLKKEVKHLENQLEEFGSGVSAISFEEKIGSSGIPSSIQEKRSILIEKLINARLTALEEYIKIETYINKVEDTEIRAIMIMRFQELKNWDEIGEELHMDRTTVSKKLRRYLQVSHISHS